MKLINREGIWHAQFKTRKNTEGDVSLGTSDYNEAVSVSVDTHIDELERVSSVVDLSHQVVTQIINGVNLTVGDTIAKWLEHVTSAKFLSPSTIYANHGFLVHFCRDQELLAKPLSSVTPKHVSDYVNGGGEKRSSALRKLSAIRQFFAFCNDSGFLYRNPAGKSLVKVTYSCFKHEEKETKERGTFTDGELVRLLEVSNDPFWKAAIQISRYSGLRLGDIAQLEWSSFRQDRLIVWTDKANKRVDLPLNEEIKEALGELTDTGIQYVFPRERDIALDPKRRAGLSTQFSRLCAKAGIHGRSFHCLRHTNATGLVAGGATLDEVALRLGHSSTVTTQGYVHARV